MKSHLKALVNYSVVVLAFFFIVGQAGFWLLKPLVGHSDFRVAVAANPRNKFNGKDIIGVIGDSRTMDGFNGRNANRLYGGPEVIYNFGFNGLRLDDSASMIETFVKQCDCRLQRLYINAEGFENEVPGTSEFQIFVSAFNSELIDRMTDKSWTFRWALRLFPLLHFNNEVFHRSLWYAITQRDDQDGGNNYQFKIHEKEISKLRMTDRHISVDQSRASTFMSYLKQHKIALGIIVTPHHGLYVANKRNFLGYLDEVRAFADSLGADFYDHSSLFAHRPEYFADLIHLNTNGQRAYTETLVNTVFRHPVVSAH